MYKTCCDGLARAKCVLFKLIIPLMIVDLLLTGYIVSELFSIDVDACCTDNLTLKNECSYEKIGDANKIKHTDGFCIAPDGTNCEGNLAQCAADYNVDLNKLCSRKVLKQVSSYNFGLFGIFLIIKGIGLIFLLALEFKNCCKKKNSNSNSQDETYGKVDEENNVVIVEKKRGCCSKCKTKICNCCKKMFIYMLKIFFIFFGMIVSMVIFYLLKKYKDVTFGSCDSLNDGIISQCKTMSKNCIGKGQHSIYNVYFKDLDLDGPFWIQTSSSVLGSILWLTRLAVLRQKWKNSVFSKVTNTLTSVNLDKITGDIQNGNKLAEVLI